MNSIGYQTNRMTNQVDWYCWSIAARESPVRNQLVGDESNQNVGKAERRFAETSAVLIGCLISRRRRRRLSSRNQRPLFPGAARPMRTGPATTTP